MKTILYIDTSDSTETKVSLKYGDKTIGIKEKTGKQKSQNVLPLIDKLLKQETTLLKDLTEIEVNPGPGSFTGVRVGMAVANTFAWTLEIPINGKKPPVLPVYSPSRFD